MWTAWKLKLLYAVVAGTVESLISAHSSTMTIFQIKYGPGLNNYETPDTHYATSTTTT